MRVIWWREEELAQAWLVEKLIPLTTEQGWMWRLQHVTGWSFFRYKRTFIQRYLASRGSPCADEQGHWQPTEPVWSFLQCWQSSDSGSQTENRAHGSQTLTTAGSTFHCLCEDKRAALENNINKYGKEKKRWMWRLISNLCCQRRWIPGCFHGGAWSSDRSLLPGTRTSPLWRRRSSPLHLRPSSVLATPLRNDLYRWFLGGQSSWPQFAGQTEAGLHAHTK